MKFCSSEELEDIIMQHYTDELYLKLNIMVLNNHETVFTI